MNRSRALAPVTLGCALALAGPAHGEAQSTSLVGTVAEAGSSQPIPYALVAVAGGGGSALTNSTGQFTIVDVAPGALTLDASALGYQTAAVQIVVSAGAETSVAITLAADPLRIERIVVTADKTARSSQDVAAFTSVVDKEDVDARGDLELVDAVENIAGVMHTLQAGSFESIELRGMPRGGNEFESTLLLVDGVPQTDSRNSARIINLPITHADAVEVVRGPNSALYGRTAIGGAINVMTAQPTPTAVATAEVQVGQFGHRRAALSASGPAADWAGYFVSWASTDNDGFYSRDPAYDVDENSIFGKLTFTPDASSEAMVSLNNVVSDNSLPTSLPVVGGELLSTLEPNFGLLDNINLPSANFRQEELRLTARYARELGSRVSFKNTFGYRDFLYAFQESGDVLGSPFDLVANTLTMYPFSLQTEEEVFYEEGQLTLRPAFGGLEQELLLGASYERTTGFRSGDLIYTDTVTFGMPIDYLAPTRPARATWEYDPFGGDEYRLGGLGLYYQYRVAPLARFELTASGRYDRLNMRNVETFQAGEPSIDETFEAFSPKFSALVKVLDGNSTGSGPIELNAYATYSAAFKPPRTPHLLNPGSTDPPLDPEDVTNYEVGVKGVIAGGRASVDATYFHMKRDGIVVSTRQGPFFLPSNAGGQDFDGVELAAALAPVPRLSLTANAALYHNRFGDFVIETSGGDTDLTGNRLPLVPDRILNLGATIAATDDVGLTMGFKSVGDRYLDQQNTYLLDSYMLLDGSVSWTPGPLRFTVSARNLLDERYFGSGDTSLAESVELGAPRQLVLGLAFMHR